MKKKSVITHGLIALILSVFLSTTPVVSAENSQAWDKTFAQNDMVTVEKVSYKNRLGIDIVADMYFPKNMDRAKKSPAIIVGHPFGGVKEQTSGLYAQEMAERGFVTLAYDASYNGESGGQPRNIASLEALVEDFSAAVDFLGTRPFVDRNRIGVIGVCASGGFAINAAQVDPRLKAVATVSMYDMGRATREGVGYAPVPSEIMTEEERMRVLEEAAEQRYIEFEGGEKIFGLGTAVELKPSQQAALQEFIEYYGTPRGAHPHSAALSLTSTGSLMNFFPFSQIETISPRPILFIAGENAHSRYYSEDAYKLAGESKELYIVPGAGHVDLYDRMEYIPFDKLESFFSKNLKGKGTSVTTAPSASNVLVNGSEVAFEAYNINGNNFFKLRDLAMAVNGSEKQFEVSWDAANNAINLLSSRAYTPVGGELAVSAKPESKRAMSTNSKIYVNGEEIQLTAYHIDGNNYFELRDIAKVFNIGVTWDGNTKTAGIDTMIDYKEE